MSTAKDGYVSFFFLIACSLLIISSQELLVAVLEAHGGLSRWNLVEKIRVVLNFYGAALELKGKLTFHKSMELTIRLRNDMPFTSR